MTFTTGRVTRIAPHRADKILGTVRWMGANIVEVTSLQTKPGYEGRKSSFGFSKPKRKRGRRGMRRGKARERQSRDTPSSGPPTRKGTPQSARRAKELRFRKWILGNYERLDNVRKNGGKKLVRVSWRGGERFIWKAEWSVRLRRWKNRWLSIRSDDCSPPFSIKDLDASFKKFLALKHGTWENVLALQGVSPTGEYTLEGEPTSWEIDRRKARLRAQPPPSDSPLTGCTHSFAHVWCDECGGCCMRGSAPQCCNRHLDKSGRRLPSVDLNRRGERKRPRGRGRGATPRRT